MGDEALAVLAADADTGVMSTGRRLAPIWLFDAGLVAAGLALWVFVLSGMERAPIVATSLPWWALTLVFYLAEAYVVHLQFRRQRHAISLGAVGLVLGLYVLSPGGLLCATLVGAASALVLVRRQRPGKLVFNLAQLALTTEVALIVFRWVAGLGDPFGFAGWAGVMLGAVASSLTGIVLVTVAIGISEGSLDLRRLPLPVAISFVSTVVVSSVVLIAITLARADAASLALIVLPIAIAVMGFRAYVAQARRQEHLEFLYESMKATQGASEFTLAVNQLLMAVRQLVRAEYAEIVLFPANGQPGVRSTVGPLGPTTTHPDAPDPADIQVESALAEAGGVLLLPIGRAQHPLDGYLAVRRLPDAMVAPLRGEDGAFGFLVVGNRVGDVATFNGDDRRLLETFVGHASVMLENGRLERSLAEVTDLKERLRHQAFHDPDRPAEPGAVHRARRGCAGARVGRRRDASFSTSTTSRRSTTRWATRSATRCWRKSDAASPVACGPRTRRPAWAATSSPCCSSRSTEHGTEVVAESLLKAMRRPFGLPGREAAINASIGIAPAANAGSADELLRNADVAMYSAKESGKHCFAHYDPSMHAKVRLRHEFALGLRKALERNEIGVAYEPIVDLRHGRIVAFEALVRWHSPERGVVMPTDFLPVAEEIGVMNQIGQRVLKLACREARKWQETYPGFGDVEVSVNLSPSELSAESLADGVARALFESRLAAEHLRLEITESDVMRDIDSAHLRMEELRALGVKLVLDDFGTGRLLARAPRHLPARRAQDREAVRRPAPRPDGRVQLHRHVRPALGVARDRVHRRGRGVASPRPHASSSAAASSARGTTSPRRCGPTSSSSTCGRFRAPPWPSRPRARPRSPRRPRARSRGTPSPPASGSDPCGARFRPGARAIRGLRSVMRTDSSFGSTASRGRMATPIPAPARPCTTPFSSVRKTK